MEKQLHTWRFVLQNLQQHIPVMLLYVLESKGSSPGRQGFFMAVAARGGQQGSIGGGVMEHKFVEMAKAKLVHAGPEQSVRRQVHDKSAAKDQSGMICSGEQTVFACRLSPEATDTVQAIVHCLEQHGNGLLQLGPEGLLFSGQVPEADFHYAYRSDTDWLYREKLGYKHRLHVVGAGHCALALCRLMRMMDFYIYLYDDRPALNTFTENSYAHEKILLGNYSELEERIAPGSRYVVVMTAGYRTDDLAIRTLMHKRFTYLGVLGSSKKLEKMFAVYRKEGIAEQVLDAIHAPIGIPVNSQTPEEIAVSIAAEIIAVKNKLQKA